MRNAAVLFSPVVFGHPLAQHGLPAGWRFWERRSAAHCIGCGQRVVLTLDGWRESVGVQTEIRLAGELGKPVRYLESESGGTAATLAHVAKEAKR